jgi:hypothetical protein
MQPSLLEQYRISDFLDWKREDRLILNPDFQRGSVWKPQAKTFLIDTILRRLPMPKIYLRTKIDVVTKRSVREVVDGQQRLRAILEFAEDGFKLSKRSEEFVGKKYSTLTEEEKETFLAYPIAVDQLINASNQDVLEVFARLNSYTVLLNGPEKRHAKYQTDFKWTVRGASQKWRVVWEDYSIFSTQERVRMLDDSFTAELIGVLLDGVNDGGDAKIDALYNRYKHSFNVSRIDDLDKVMQSLTTSFLPALAGTVLLQPPHLLMLFAALAAVTVGIPQGSLTIEEWSTPDPLVDRDKALENLLTLAEVITSESVPEPPFDRFWQASRATTHRISSRRIRFPIFVKSLTKSLTIDIF